MHVHPFMAHLDDYGEGQGSKIKPKEREQLQAAVKLATSECERETGDRVHWNHRPEKPKVGRSVLTAL